MTPHGEHKLGMHRTYRRTYCPECMGTVGATVPASAPAKVKRARAHVARRVDAMIAEVVAESKHQTTRMKRVSCKQCGCLIRMTRKWLDDAGAPTCACGGMMQEDAA